MLYKIKLWWKYEGRYYHKDLINGIKNLWNWFPVIWKDRDYDHHHIYEILIHKLEKQAKYISEKNITSDSKRNAEKMLLCARLVRIQQEDLYGFEYLDYLDEDTKFVPTDETEKWYMIESVTTRDELIDYFYKYRRQHKLLMYKGNKDNKYTAMRIARNNQERSRKLLFKIMEENIEKWWH